MWILIGTFLFPPLFWYVLLSILVRIVIIIEKSATCLNISFSAMQVSHTNLCHGNNFWGCCRACRHIIILHSSIFSKTPNVDSLRAQGEDSDTAMITFEASDACWMTHQALNLHWSCDIKVLYTSRSHSVRYFILPKREESNCSYRYCRAWSCKRRRVGELNKLFLFCSCLT